MPGKLMFLPLVAVCAGMMSVSLSGCTDTSTTNPTPTTPSTTPASPGTPAAAAPSQDAKAQKVATPAFTPPAGTYAGAQTVTISTTTPGAAIRFTTDGSTPSGTVGSVYSSAVTVAATETIMAIAYAAGAPDSAVASAAYMITGTVATPSFSPKSGTYFTDQSVTITCATPGAAIHYTTDGSTPTGSSPTYTAPVSVEGNGTNETIRAIATDAEMTASGTGTATYVITYQVAAPAFNPAAGTYSTDQSVTITCATEGAVIHYTTNNTAPSASSPVYSAPIAVAGNGTKATLQALAVKEGMTASGVGTADFIIRYPQAATPVFNPIGGTYSSNRSVTISSATPGAEIHYTTDGSTPTASSAAYAGPLSVAGNGTHEIIKAIAIKTGMAASGTGTVIYDIYDSWQAMGALGSGSSQFAYPTGVTLDAGGRIYVADYGNSRIVRMDDLSGTGWTAFGRQGRDSGQFNHPSRVAVDSLGRIYVADMSNNRIVRMDDMSGAGWTAFGAYGSGSGQFNSPAGIAMDSGGHIYVADSGNNRIVRMDDMGGAQWTAIGAHGSEIDQLDDPVGVAVDAGGRIYVTDYGNYRIVRMDDMSGGGWTVLGTSGHSGHGGINQFNHPASVSVDAAGHIYVADMANSRVVRMDDMAGANWTALGGPGNGVSQFNRPWGVAVDASGRVYVADNGNNRIARFVLQ